MRRMIRGVALAALLFAFLSCGDRPPSQPQPLSDADHAQAPDFLLKDTKDGTFRLNSFAGRPVLLVFVTTWCPSCRSEIPRFKEIYAAYGQPGQGLEMAAVNIQEPKEKVARFADRFQIPYPVLVDDTGMVAQAYGIRGVPSMILIGRDGRVICRQCPDLDRQLEALLGKR